MQANLYFKLNIVNLDNLSIISIVRDLLVWYIFFRRLKDLKFNGLSLPLQYE